MAQFFVILQQASAANLFSPKPELHGFSWKYRTLCTLGIQAVIVKEFRLMLLHSIIVREVIGTYGVNVEGSSACIRLC